MLNSIRFWRLLWVWKEINNFSNYRKKKHVLKLPYMYWITLFAKFVPGVWPWPIHLSFKRGGGVDIKEFMTLYIFNEVFIDACYDIAQIPDEKPLIIDVGANVGFFAVRMKQLYPQSSLLCFEPFPQNYTYLKKHLDQKPFSDCNAYQKGIGNTTRKVKLYIHDRNTGGHSIHADQALGSDSIEIDLISLREVLSGLDGKICNLLKLDCEGAEYEIIKGMDCEMAKRIERIVFEPSPQIYNVDDLTTHLNDLGYHTESKNGLYIAEYRN